MKYNYNRLLGKMKELGVSQEELAKSLGVNPATVSQKLNNKGLFKQSEIVKICNILSIDGKDIGDYFFAH